MNTAIHTIAEQFSHQTIISVVPFGDGNINDTYLVTTDKEDFILQRINPVVFPDPRLILANQTQLQKLLAAEKDVSPPFTIPSQRLTCQGKNHYKDEHHCFWRAQEFIKDGREIPTLHHHHGQSVGQLLGFFHGLCSPETACRFHVTLPNIHATRLHLQCYTTRRSSTIKEASPMRLHFCTTSIETYRAEAAQLDHILHEPNLIKRLIHGDPKQSNILFDHKTERACSLIDLDTIGPGPILHDLSDLIRSCCNHAREDEPEAEVIFDLPLAMEIINGYSQVTTSFLSQGEISILGSSLWLMPFELAVRFLNDYLAGSIYFKTSHPQQNLIRSYNQFKLAEQIHQNQHVLQDYVHHCFS